MPHAEPVPSSNSETTYQNSVYDHLPSFASFTETSLPKKTVFINGECVYDPLEQTTYPLPLSKPKPKPASKVSTLLNRERAPWTEREDNLLRTAVHLYGDRTEKWAKIAMCVPGRTNKNCRKRWFHSLDPTLRKGAWTEEEDSALRQAVLKFPGQWSKIAETIPGRTDDQCAKRWRESLDPEIERSEWRPEEDELLLKRYSEIGSQWQQIAKSFPGRPGLHCRNRWRKLHRSPALIKREMHRRKNTSTGDIHFESTYRSDNADWYHVDDVSKEAPPLEELQYLPNCQNLHQTHPHQNSPPLYQNVEHQPERDVMQSEQQQQHIVRTHAHPLSSLSYASPTDLGIFTSPQLQPSNSNFSPRPDGSGTYHVTNSVDEEVPQTPQQRNFSQYSFQLPQFISQNPSYPTSGSALPPISSYDSGQHFGQQAQRPGPDFHQSRLAYQYLQPHKSSPLILNTYGNRFSPDDAPCQQHRCQDQYEQQPFNHAPYDSMESGEAPIAIPKGYYSHQQPTPLQTPIIEHSPLLSQQRWNEPAMPFEERYHSHYTLHQHTDPERQLPPSETFSLCCDQANGRYQFQDRKAFSDRDDTTDLQNHATNWQQQPTPQPDSSESPYQDASWTIPTRCNHSESHDAATSIDDLALTARIAKAIAALDNEKSMESEILYDPSQNSHLPFTRRSASPTNASIEANAAHTTADVNEIFRNQADSRTIASAEYTPDAYGGGVVQCPSAYATPSGLYYQSSSVQSDHADSDFSRPYVCNFDGCTKNYTDITGLEYHLFRGAEQAPT